MKTQFQGRVFDRKPMFYTNQLRRLEDYITPTMRRQAAQITRQVWDFDKAKILDQKNTGHCTGFAWANFGICAPECDDWENDAGHRIYYESVARGGYPNSEDGSTTDWGAQAMRKDENRISAYAFANNIDDVIVWLKTKGPAVTGTWWYESMMSWDRNYQIHPSGNEVGGHNWALRGVDTSVNLLFAIQSWGPDYADGGLFAIPIPEYKPLLDDNGDCCMAVELPLADPTPQPPPVPAGCSKADVAAALRLVQNAMGRSGTLNKSFLQKAFQAGIDSLLK